tara:strand:- start:217 stop:426 length:210 start_codon:yes stop_codon:yes gene_type:complete
MIKRKMIRLLLLTPLLVGCTNGGGGFGYNGGGVNYNPPGTAGSYTCESAGSNAQAYYDTGEHPNLADCL